MSARMVKELCSRSCDTQQSIADQVSGRGWPSGWYLTSACQAATFVHIRRLTGPRIAC
jgi:hypothetical protein